jgi:tetratricopeptide (TPR) repeat protein
MTTRPSVAKKKTEARYQAAVKNLELALRHMHRGNYTRAAEIFQKLVTDPIHELAHRARVHLHHCQHQLNPPVYAPKSAEDFYNLGVFELNSHALDLAIAHLAKAARMKPALDHIHYALAAAYALRGDPDPALQHLGKALALRPESRFQAQADQDLASLAHDPRFRQLLNAPRSQG